MNTTRHSSVINVAECCSAVGKWNLAPLGLYDFSATEPRAAPWAIEPRPVGQRREGFRHGEMRVAEVVRLRRTHGPFKDGPNSHEFGYKNPSRRRPCRGFLGCGLPAPGVSTPGYYMSPLRGCDSSPRSSTKFDASALRPVPHARGSLPDRIVRPTVFARTGENRHCVERHFSPRSSRAEALDWGSPRFATSSRAKRSSHPQQAKTGLSEAPVKSWLDTCLVERST